MRLLADENVPLMAVQALRKKGHDIPLAAMDESQVYYRKLGPPFNILRDLFQ